MNDSYTLAWRFDATNITFRITAATTGWVGLGFSRSGGMASADIVLAWVDESGKGYISVRVTPS